jgi:hypothetical protein
VLDSDLLIYTVSTMRENTQVNIIFGIYAGLAFEDYSS